MSNYIHPLYGDGIHDDTAAIQERIDAGLCELALPAPAVRYLISKPLTLPSHFRLTLPRYAEIRLADGSNCPMLTNRPIREYAERLPAELSPICRQLWYFVNEYAPEVASCQIEVTGGIWDFNNQNQIPNPEQRLAGAPYGYTGDGMFFFGVKGLRMADMTLKDPVHYGVVFDRVSYFTVENIVFDYNYGNPNPGNMDGFHCNGNCHFGVFRNLKGACYDDLVALNAHEGSKGPITNIQIDGIFAEGCHSAVRLLTVEDEVRNIHISNVYGTYFQYCIGLSKHYQGAETGIYAGITLEHIYASKAERLPVFEKDGSYVFPLIWVDKVRVDTLVISDLSRDEFVEPVETIHISHGAKVRRLWLDKLVTRNHTGRDMPLLVNHGTVEAYSMTNVDSAADPVLLSDGEMGTC